MAIVKTVYWKIRNYYKHYGAKRTAQRLKESVRRLLFSNRDVVFYMDLVDWSPKNAGCWGLHTVDRVTRESEFPETCLDRILEHLPPEVFVNHMNRRFGKGGSLWCLRNEKDLIGFLWVLIGDTMQPHYFPLIASDVHIFDGFILPQYRGQDKNALMMDLVMDRLKRMGLRRAYVETKEWNTPARRALEKMQFRALGFARQRFRKGRTVVTWWAD